MSIETIKYDEYEAKIDVDNGATCISLKNVKYNASLLRECEGEKSTPYLYGMPILFPANRIETGVFVFDGREYKFPVTEERTNCFIHGDLCQRKFNVLSKTRNTIECSYVANKNNRYYGFANEFEIRIEYMLSDNGLSQNTKISNLSPFSMPVMLGFHTTFNVPFINDSNKDDVLIYADIDFEIERNINYLPTGKISKDDFVKMFQKGEFSTSKNPVSKHCFAKDSGKMVMYDKSKNLSLVYENDEKFKYRLLYNGDGKEFICLEPQTNFVNFFKAEKPNDISGFDVILPNESKVYKSLVSIKEGDFR
ncbi:MAG: aldose 1-epimerase [Ruminococcaceae bacterium]|nr:aldose 1-epimerase [Oscillospiraceae bacterium]